MSEPKIRIERVGNALWRIYSLDDMGGEFIDLERQGMKELLDELLKIAGQFDASTDETPDTGGVCELSRKP